MVFERIRDDPGVFMKYVRVQLQLADLVTKTSFASLQCEALCTLCLLGPRYDIRPEESVAEKGNLQKTLVTKSKAQSPSVL